MAESQAGEFSVRRVDWGEEQAALRAIRYQVFVLEQGVPVDLEWDGFDPECIHVLAANRNGAAIGTARLMPEGRIGRMAVLQTWRRRGVASALLQSLVDIATARGDPHVVLHAQSSVVPFYAQHGFIAEGPEFIEAGIRHRPMRRVL
jgi:predicted GNAT family N-acyltransferase